MSVSETVKALSLGRLMRMPVIEEEVVQKSCASARSLIEIEKLAKSVIEIGYIQAVLETGSAAVVGEILHLTHNTAFKQVGNEGVVLAVLVFEICLETNGF